MVTVSKSQLDGRLFPSPNGIALRRGNHGLGLYATRRFLAGEIIYTSEWFAVPDDDQTYRVLVEIDGSVEEIDITTAHSVRFGDLRMLDIPGCFMNHACEPTSSSIDHESSDGHEPATAYDQVASVAVYPGDEVTCDYVLFDWDCHGHQFACNCGAPSCRGRIAGFAALPQSVQESLSSRVNTDVARMWRHARECG